MFIRLATTGVVSTATGLCAREPPSSYHVVSCDSWCHQMWTSQPRSGVKMLKRAMRRSQLQDADVTDNDYNSVAVAFFLLTASKYVIHGMPPIVF